MEDKSVNKELKFLDSLEKDKVTTNAFKKLNREPLEIGVYRNSSLVQKLEEELDFIDEELKKNPSESDTKKLNELKDKVNTKLKEEENNKIVGLLTGLTYRDINDIKAAITEAVIHFNTYQFDPEVKLARVIAEERFMTVFCALKRKDNPKQRYFKSLEEIAMTDDVTIFDLYEKWEHHFSLSEDELKN